jgi:hypothetical protein
MAFIVIKGSSLGLALFVTLDNNHYLHRGCPVRYSPSFSFLD